MFFLGKTFINQLGICRVLINDFLPLFRVSDAVQRLFPCFVVFQQFALPLLLSSGITFRNSLQFGYTFSSVLVLLLFLPQSFSSGCLLVDFGTQPGTPRIGFLQLTLALFTPKQLCNRMFLVGFDLGNKRIQRGNFIQLGLVPTYGFNSIPYLRRTFFNILPRPLNQPKIAQYAFCHILRLFGEFPLHQCNRVLFPTLCLQSLDLLVNIGSHCPVSC